MNSISESSLSDFYTSTATKFFSQTKSEQLILSMNDKIVLKVGDSIFDWKNLELMMDDLKKFDLIAVLLNKKIRFNKIKTLDNGFYIYTFSLFFNSNFLRVIFLFSNSNIPNEENFKNLVEFSFNFYGNIPKLQETKINNLYPDFSYKIMKKIESYFESNDEKGVIAHFYIQNLDYFYSYFNEEFANQIHLEIKKEIKKFLKQKDLFFRFSQNSYMTYSHNCNSNTVKERYKDVLFELKNLVIQFELEFYDVDFKTFKKQSFWDKAVSFQSNLS